MRYIDADALFKTLKKRYWHYVRNYGDNDEYANCTDDCMEIVLDQPTADVKQIVRGEWELHKDGSGTCTVCGTKQKAVWDMDSWQNFCGHCGADMKGAMKNEVH